MPTKTNKNMHVSFTYLVGITLKAVLEHFNNVLYEEP